VTQISLPIRIVALAGLLLAVVGGSAMIMLRHSSPAASPPVPLRVTTPARPASAPARLRAATPPATAARTRAAAPAATPPTRARAAKPTTARRGNLVDARLPRPLQWALTQHRIVVVSLYNPRADVDAISVAEAHAGAKDAQVGFLLVNVLDNAVAGRLTGLLPTGGLLPDPGTLVYRAPGRLVYMFDGFLDRAAIAQAATNAKHGQSDPTLAASAPATTGGTP
jgi:hypothetical protein